MRERQSRGEVNYVRIPEGAQRLAFSDIILEFSSLRAVGAIRDYVI